MPFVEYPKTKRNLAVVAAAIVVVAMVTGGFFLFRQLSTPKQPVVKKPVIPTDLKQKFARPANLTPAQSMQYDVEDLTYNKQFDLAANVAKYYSQQATSDNDRIQGILELGVVYDKQHDYVDALKLYQDAAKKYGPRVNEIQMGIATTAEELHKNDVAIAAYKQMINNFQGQSGGSVQADIERWQDDITRLGGRP